MRSIAKTMNETQRINALNEWFLEECRFKSGVFVHEAIREWDTLSGMLPPFGMWIEQKLVERWLDWVRSN